MDLPFQKTADAVGEAILRDLESRRGLRQVMEEIKHDGTSLYDEMKRDLGMAALLVVGQVSYAKLAGEDRDE
ncbi:MAG: hypothetical protein ACYSUC_11425 [Planctomycetota bacterium]|jgi:hypothetical protein